MPIIPETNGFVSLFNRGVEGDFVPQGDKLFGNAWKHFWWPHCEEGTIGIEQVEAIDAAKTSYKAQDRSQQRIRQPKVSIEPRLRNCGSPYKERGFIRILNKLGEGKSKAGKSASNLLSLNTNPHSCGEECLPIGD